MFGEIIGASLKSYGEIKKRGSVIRQIIDREGNKIAGFESDKLILERVQEGANYDVPIVVIPGYSFERLADNSAPQKGVVKEGVQNVILAYVISSISQTVEVNAVPDLKGHIPDFEKNFPGCEVKYKTTPNTSTPREIDAIFVISCPDQPDREANVKIIVSADVNQEIKAPNTGGRSDNFLPSALAGISIVALMAAIFFRKKL